MKPLFCKSKHPPFYIRLGRKRIEKSARLKYALYCVCTIQYWNPLFCLQYNHAIILTTIRYI